MKRFLIQAFMGIGLSLVIFWALTTPPLLGVLAKTLHVNAVPQKGDVIVALSSGLMPDCKPPFELFNRETFAANLLRKGYSRSGKLIISGQYTDGLTVSVKTCRHILAQRLQIPDDSLIIDNQAFSTLDNATNTQKIMTQHGWQNVVVVTVDSHMKRALAVFLHLGMTAYPVPVADRGGTDSYGFDWKRVQLLHRFLYEYGALVFYKCYGYL